MANSSATVKQEFFEWLHYDVSSQDYDDIQYSYNRINMLLDRTKVVRGDITSLLSIKQVDSVIKMIPKVFVGERARRSANKLLCEYRKFLEERNEPINSSAKDQGADGDEFSQEAFFEWLSKSVSPAQLSALYDAFIDLEKNLSFAVYGTSLSCKLSRVTNAAFVRRLYNDLRANSSFVRYKDSQVKLAVLLHFEEFLKDNKKEKHDIVVKHSDNQVQRQTQKTKPENKEVHVGTQSQKSDRVPDKGIDSMMDSDLDSLLKDPQYFELRRALLSKGIRTIETFKQLNLWVFMNENGLYSISKRYAIFNQLQNQQSNKSGKKYQLKTTHFLYAGATPAEVFIAYCEKLAQRMPLRFRIAIGTKDKINGANILSWKRFANDNVYMRNPIAFADGKMTATEALRYAQQICLICKDTDTPLTLEELRQDEEVEEDNKKQALVDDTTLEGIKTDGPDSRILTVDFHQSNKYVYTKPVSIIYRGRTIKESTWQSLYKDFCGLLYRDYEKQILKLAKSPLKVGVGRQFTTEKDKRKFFRPKAFAPGIYLEAQLSATYIMDRIRELWEFFDLGDQLVIQYYQDDDTRRDVLTTAGQSDLNSFNQGEKAEEKIRPQSIDHLEAQTVDKNQTDIGQKEQLDIDSVFQKRVEQVVLEADLEGVSINELAEVFPAATITSLKRIRDYSKEIMDVSDRLIHIDAFVDLDEAAEKLHELIEKLLNRNNGYTTAVQLYEYAHTEMQMFLNDNGMDDERSVFCIAKFLFEKIQWHGYTYSFVSGSHISRNGEGAINSNLEVIQSYARSNGGFFSYEELLEYLERVGVKTGNLRTQMQIGIKPIFFYYSSDDIITAESMNIDEKWMLQAKKAFQRLFADAGDHIIFRTINPVWYEQLPTLPGNRSWTSLLLQHVLQFYGDSLGARTIGSELIQKYNVLHSMLVSDKSEIKTFADSVVAYLVDNGIEERQFEAEELRRLLISGEMIAGGEMISKMQKAIGLDPRFAWDNSGENVTIKV